MKKHIQIITLILIISIGAYLRFKLLSRPLWIDEVKGLEIVREYSQIFTKYHGREIFTVTLNKIIGIDSLFMIRLPFVLFSLGTIIAAYIVIENKFAAGLICTVLSFSPLFVYWGTMARPYVPALFFCILGYRWKWCYIPALLVTPYSLIGLNLFKIKNRWILYLSLFLIAFTWYWFLPINPGSHFNLEFLTNAKRLWIIPVGTYIVHLADYTRLRSLFKDNK